MKIEIKNRFTGDVIIGGKYNSIKECLEKNRGAYLSGAYLSRADLYGASLRGANLRGADLGGVKNYSEQHGIFQEVIRQQSLKLFTEKEWACIGQICVHKICWNGIKKRWGNTAMRVFKKLSEAGFIEWEEKYKGIISKKGE